MTDITKLKSCAIAVRQWSNCNKSWLDTSEDNSSAVVGHIDEDGNCYDVATIDCDQYYAGQDSLPLANFYANANPASVLALIERIESTEKQRDRLLSALDHILSGALCLPRFAELEARSAIASIKGNTA